MTTSRTTSLRALGALVGSFLVLVTGVLWSSTAQALPAGTGCSGAYGWPVKPFDRAHPVRGNFGDPRTVFEGRRSQRTVDHGAGTFQFHHGVDISAPDGSPVYAVADGRITRTHGDRVTVECGNGRSFQYWHIEVPRSVRVGQYAEAGKTLLGYILPKREHVHLTELEGSSPVNPLAGGHLGPYRDTTKPNVVAISFRRTDLGSTLRPARVSGRAHAYVEATDMPALAVPGRWHGFPVTPALVSWRIQSTRGKVVLAERVAWDVRRAIPPTEAFWSAYSRRTHQNWPVFSDGKARGMTGRYVFRLSSRALDLDALPIGSYELVVRVADTAGNRARGSLTFRVDTR